MKGVEPKDVTVGTITFILFNIIMSGKIKIITDRALSPMSMNEIRGGAGESAEPMCAVNDFCLKENSSCKKFIYNCTALCLTNNCSGINSCDEDGPVGPPGKWDDYL